MKNPLITVFCSLICSLAIPAASNISASAQTYFQPKQSKAYLVKAEKNLRDQSPIELAENAFRAELRRLKALYNDGQDFPPRDEDLRGGRPIAA